jgi:hypothetical protein
MEKISKSMSVFLTAEWNYLINITYAVDPKVLLPYLPQGLNLDIIDGKAFVSFVAFEFNDVKVKGFKIPFHRKFPEINLRFYVNRNGKRGVVFIKEFVPKHYNEPYSAVKMNHDLQKSEIELKVSHSICIKSEWQNIEVVAENKPFTPSINSTEHYFKEHEIGFGKDKKGNTLEYKVEHPIWEIYPIKKIESTICFEKTYGKEWAFLDSEKPFSTLLAKGSKIKVFDKE